MEDMRRYLLGSLAAHVVLLVIASLMAAVFVRTPPGLRVMRLDLSSLELPAPKPVETMPEETPVQTPTPIPAAPAELPARRPPLSVDAAPEEVDDLVQADLRAPDPLLPREPREQVLTEAADLAPEATEDVDFLEPEDVSPRAEEAAADAAAAQDVSPAPPATATAEGGAVQASSTDGVSDFYLMRVQQKIGRRWRPSPGSVPGTGRAECLVHFRIGPDGAVIAPAVARSSGLSVFDRQAIRAVLDSSPMPAVPPRFAGTGLEIRFLFSYER